MAHLFPATFNRSRLAHFFSRVHVSSDCWEWQGALNNKGYGIFSGHNAHRCVYTWFVGEIQAGLTIDHLCFNRCCVNPAHLEAVTDTENKRRAHARRPACHVGHSPSRVTMRRYKYGDKCSVYRECLDCHRDRQALYYARHRDRIVIGRRPSVPGSAVAS